MKRIILQVPMQKTLRDEAAEAAVSQGFSSLQEAIRVLLKKLARKELTFVATEPEERLSPRAAARYDKMVDDVRSGKVKTKSFTSVDALMEHLNS
jgi:antitoxin component of RelBE/YafQ-DinJ toxin-antitoxin module